jgi:hypothetical protein
MPQNLYDEALADVKKVTEVAENNAKKAVLDAVVPRIKQLIESQLMDTMGEDDALMADDGLDPLATPSPAVDSEVDPADAISTPDEEGKVTIDLDALEPVDDSGAVEGPHFGGPDAEYEISLESLNSLKAVKAGTVKNLTEMKREYSLVVRELKKFAAAGKLIRESNGYRDQIARMISRVENMYEYLQEHADPASQSKYSNNLETIFQKLKELQETAMSKTRKLNEEDETQMDLGMGDEVEGEDAPDEEAGGDELTLTLTGLGDVDLEDVGVDLVGGEGEEVDDLGVEDDMGDEGGEEEVDLGGLDLGDEEPQLEVTELSDDTVVEISESMLKREIRRMAQLREGDEEGESSGQPSDELDANGQGVNDGVLDDFGGASAEGEPLTDVDVTTADNDSAEPLGEGEDEEEPMDEMDELDEMDDVNESARRRLGFEKRVQTRAKAQVKALKVEAKKASGRKLRAIKARYSKVAKRFNESLARTKKIKAQLNEAAKGVRLNSTSNQPAGKADAKLRKKLSESNLDNVKLVFANKVLQNESLSKRQKAQVMKRLDECKTPREAKLVYTSVVKAVGSKGKLSEGAPRGSGSQATRSGQPKNLNEGFETARWSKLAGITK